MRLSYFSWLQKEYGFVGCSNPPDEPASARRSTSAADKRHDSKASDVCFAPGINYLFKDEESARKFYTQLISFHPTEEPTNEQFANIIFADALTGLPAITLTRDEDLSVVQQAYHKAHPLAVDAKETQLQFIEEAERYLAVPQLRDDLNLLHTAVVESAQETAIEHRVLSHNFDIFRAYHLLLLNYLALHYDLVDDTECRMLLQACDSLKKGEAGLKADWEWWKLAKTADRRSTLEDKVRENAARLLSDSKGTDQEITFHTNDFVVQIWKNKNAVKVADSKADSDEYFVTMYGGSVLTEAAATESAASAAHDEDGKAATTYDKAVIQVAFPCATHPLVFTATSAADSAKPKEVILNDLITALRMISLYSSGHSWEKWHDIITPLLGKRVDAHSRTDHPHLAGDAHPKTLKWFLMGRPTKDDNGLDRRACLQEDCHFVGKHHNGATLLSALANKKKELLRLERVAAASKDGNGADAKGLAGGASVFGKSATKKGKATEAAQVTALETANGKYEYEELLKDLQTAVTAARTAHDNHFQGARSCLRQNLGVFTKHTRNGQMRASDLKIGIDNIINPENGNRVGIDAKAPGAAAASVPQTDKEKLIAVLQLLQKHLTEAHHTGEVSKLNTHSFDSLFLQEINDYEDLAEFFYGNTPHELETEAQRAAAKRDVLMKIGTTLTALNPIDAVTPNTAATAAAPATAAAR